MTVNPKYKNPNVFGKHIVHLEKLKPKELLEFLTEWNSNPCLVTEKVDGMFFTFGKDAKGFYVGSKNTKKHSLEEIPSNLYYLQPLKTGFENLSNLAFHSVLNYQNYFHVECEYIPSHDYNIVQYNPDIIKNDGTFVVYSVKTDEEFQTVDQTLINSFNELVDNEQITFALNPVVKTDFIYDKNMIKKLARSIKEQPVDLTIADDFKTSFLNSMSSYVSVFGCKSRYEFVEGFVFHTPKRRVKVTVPKFNSVKNFNWQPIKNISDCVQNLVKETNRVKMHNALLCFSHGNAYNADYEQMRMFSFQEIIMLKKRLILMEKKIFVDQKLFLPKKLNDILSYFRLVENRMANYECLITTASDMQGFEVAVELLRTNKLDI